MQLTDYSIGDLTIYLSAITNYREAVKSADDFTGSQSTEELMSLIHFENDIEQAIKDKEFERDQTTLPPL